MDINQIWYEAYMGTNKGWYCKSLKWAILAQGQWPISTFKVPYWTITLFTLYLKKYCRDSNQIWYAAYMGNYKDRCCKLAILAHGQWPIWTKTLFLYA